MPLCIDIIVYPKYQIKLVKFVVKFYFEFFAGRLDRILFIIKKFRRDTSKLYLPFHEHDETFC